MKRFIQNISVSLVLCLGVIGCTDRPDAAQQADDMAAQHENDTPETSAIVMEPRIPVAAQPIQYNLDGEPPYVGYMAAPVRPDSVAEVMGAPGDTTLPALIIIHEWWGLNDNIQAMARRLAGEGYRVLAVDLYDGQVGTTPNEAQAIMGQVLNDEAALQANLRAAYQFLKQRYDAPQVAVMGWCFGGMMTMRAAVALPTELDAAVVYYGQVGDFGEDELAPLNMPVLAFFGGQDQSIPLDDVRSFEKTLKDQGKDVTVHVYDNAGHAFANPSGTNYVESAAQDAWDKTIAFLKQTLYDKRGM